MISPLIISRKYIYITFLTSGICEDKMGKTMLWARVDVGIRDMVKKLAAIKGISMSEYVRSLVIEDLDKRTVFTSALKEAEL